jgi:hypothetical protein
MKKGTLKGFTLRSFEIYKDLECNKVNKSIDFQTFNDLSKFLTEKLKGNFIYFSYFEVNDIKCSCTGIDDNNKIVVKIVSCSPVFD